MNAFTRTHRTRRTRTTLGALAAVALLTLTACGSSDDGDAASDASSDASSSDSPSAGSSGSADAAAPDLSGIPDVVAEVDGEEITKDEFVGIYESSYQQASAQAASSGQQVDEDQLKKQTVDDLVDTELLSAEAESRGIDVSDDDVDAELSTLAEQYGMKSGDELLAAVVEQGMAEDVARSQVQTQVMVERLVEDEEGGPITPTDKELRALYEQAEKSSAQSGQEIGSFASVKSQLVDQAVATETGKVAQKIVTGLRKDADITINI